MTESVNTENWGLQPGDEIVPGLTAMRLLGGGHAYEAYLAFDDRLFTPVVVKVVRPDQVQDRSTLRGLEREVEMLERTNHPAIVRAFRARLDGPRPHLVLENLDGPRLSTLIRKHGPLPMQQLLPLGIELSAAVHYLGEVGIVHLDIKPSNTIMGAPAKLIDLSVARPVERAAELDVPIGTDDYMAPEQSVPGWNGHVPSEASDVFGIGATLFHAAAGFKPYPKGARDDATAPPEARWPQLVEEPYDLPDFVPGALAKLVMACLDPDPARRPTPSELAQGLEPILAAQPKARLSGFKLTR